MAQRVRVLAAVALAVLGLIMVTASASILAAAATKMAEKLSPSAEAEKRLELYDAIAILGAAVAVIGSTAASGFALRAVATAGFAAAAENPRLSAWMLIMGGLAEGIAIYGLLVAILILGKI